MSIGLTESVRNLSVYLSKQRLTDLTEANKGLDHQTVGSIAFGLNVARTLHLSSRLLSVCLLHSFTRQTIFPHGWKHGHQQFVL